MTGFQAVELITGIRPARFVRQMLLESVQRLFAQGDPVNQKEHLFSVSGAHQRIDQCDAGSRFTGASSHDEQEIPFLLLDSFEHGANGANLVVAVGDGGIDQLLRQRLAVAANVLKTFEIVAGGKTDNLSRRVVVQIPEPGVETVGVKTERQFAAELLLDVPAILLRLFPPESGVLAAFLGLDDGERLAVSAQEHVIAELMAIVRRSRLPDFFARRSQNIELFYHLHRVADIPARQGEEIVDQPRSGLRFGSVHMKQPEI